MSTNSQPYLAEFAVVGPPDQMPVAPARYFDGQFVSYSSQIMREISIAQMHLLDSGQYFNQRQLIHDGRVSGRVQPIGQNIGMLTAQAWMRPATLVPSYGVVTGGPMSVYQNIASRGNPF